MAVMCSWTEAEARMLHSILTLFLHGFATDSALKSAAQVLGPEGALFTCKKMLDTVQSVGNNFLLLLLPAAALRCSLQLSEYYPWSGEVRQNRRRDMRGGEPPQSPYAPLTSPLYTHAN
jgi:hypothetical protein